MDDIQKQVNSFSGYLLAESVLALMIVGLLIASILPAYTQFQQQLQQRSQRVEAYRFAYEIVQMTVNRAEGINLQKKSLGEWLSGEGIVDANGLAEIKVKVGGEEYVLKLVSKSQK